MKVDEWNETIFVFPFSHIIYWILLIFLTFHIFNLLEKHVKLYNHWLNGYILNLYLNHKL